MKIELTQAQLDAVIKALEDVLARYELEAAAFLRLSEGHDLAVKRLEQAKKAAELVDFFLHQ